MSPRYLFRIDEICEAPDAISHADAYNYWIPSADAGANIRINNGATGTYFMCDGQRVYPSTLPSGAQLYKTFSVYYSQGFWVLKGDATNPSDEQPWRRLNFDWETDYSSFLSNAGQKLTLAIQRPDQSWPRMLLPDIYHTTRTTSHTTYGGLIGELPIFLALMAFSIRREYVKWAMQSCFTGGRWITHDQPPGRDYQRGVVVYVWSVTGSSAQDLAQFEAGNLGKYFN